MKDIIVIVSVFIFVFGGNYYINKKVEFTGEEFLDIMENLENTIDSDDSDKKAEEVEKVLEKWEENEKLWIMIQYHDQINQAEEYFIESYNFYLQGKKDEFEISYKKLERSIEDMKNREIISFHNIL